MNRTITRWITPLVLLCFSALTAGCYNKYTITTDELEKLSSGNIAETVTVETDSGPVEVRATTPIEVVTNDGRRHAVTPFNFALSSQQLVAPDYDLLLARDQVENARVSEFNKGATIGVIVGSVLAAAGAFVAVSVLAGSSNEEF